MRPAFVYCMIGSVCVILSLAAYFFLLASGTFPRTFSHTNRGYSAELEMQLAVGELHDFREQQEGIVFGNECICIGLFLELITTVSFRKFETESRSHRKTRSALALAAMVAMIFGYFVLDSSVTGYSQANVEFFGVVMCGIAFVLFGTALGRYLSQEGQAQKTPGHENLPTDKS
jgi:hypothetical protein